MNTLSRNLAIGLSLLAVVPAFSEDDTATTKLETSTPARVTATDHLIFSNSKDPNDPEAVVNNLFMHEDTVRGEYGIVGADINFTNRYAVSGEQSQNKIFTLEKKTLSLTGETWNVKLGDSNQELGKGIALSLYNNSTFGINNTLEGFAAQYNPEGLRLNLMGGRMNALKAPVAINPTPMTLRGTAYIAAASVGGNLGAGTKLTTNYVGVMEQEESTGVISRNSHTAGLILEKEGIFDEVDVYAESNALFATQRTGGNETNQPIAVGSYAALVWSPVPWKAKLEVKDYRDYTSRDWIRVPTLEDDLISELHNRDVTAVRLYGERRIGESRSTIYSSYLIGDERESNGVINHPIVGTKLALPNHAEFEAKTGYRWMPNRNYMMHVGGKGKLRTGPGEYIELEIRKQFARTNLERGLDYNELDKYVAALTYTISEKLSATLGYEYVPTNEYATGQHFPNIGANYKTGNAVARGFVGQTSGGTQCAGGMCRQVPAFTGAMVETTVTF